ncbi:MAG: endonuclease domain-containing protein [Chloroflexota bacterium]|nr:endonuclease domain-containing protein [Chloroflexota bacterium]
MSNTAKARQLRKTLTDAERTLWNILRSRQVSGCKFRRQAPIGHYIVDFVCFENRLVIEVDGGQHLQSASYDAARTAWLEREGFRVIRFWNNQVLQETDSVREAIFIAVQRLSPPSYQSISGFLPSQE